MAAMPALTKMTPAIVDGLDGLDGWICAKTGLPGLYNNVTCQADTTQHSKNERILLVIFLGPSGSS